MPIFEYEPDGAGCKFCKGGFEVFQKMADSPLESCPECHEACHRIFSSFSVGGKGKSLLGKKNLESHGFTQYSRKGDGYYEKTAGKGPGALVDGSKQ